LNKIVWIIKSINNKKEGFNGSKQFNSFRIREGELIFNWWRSIVEIRVDNGNIG
tara:strand:- start:456 stop:617 length:162 start_codon:yes stop_codon:yes gene_type:complete